MKNTLLPNKLFDDKNFRNFSLGRAIGFDSLFDLLDDKMLSGYNTTSYPPYNLIKTSDNEYLVELAVAGFTDKDLDISQNGNQLIIRGSKTDNSEISVEKDEVTYLHRGISARSFERSFVLADYVNVESAEMKDGMLKIKLRRELPESLKPRRIEIAKSVDENSSKISEENTKKETPK